MRRHLSEQQLVDLVIGSGSRFGKLSARHHLAACALCRGDLDTLRSVDRQLEHEGGSHRLAAVPRWLGPTSAEASQINPVPPAVTATEPPVSLTPRWQRAVVPLLAAACALLALNVTIEMPEAKKAAAKPKSQVALVVPPRQVQPDPPAKPAEPAPGAVEIRSPVTSADERIDEERDIYPSSPQKSPQLAKVRPMQHPLDTASRVMCQRHPGAGRGDDRVSPPTNGV